MPRETEDFLAEAFPPGIGGKVHLSSLDDKRGESPEQKIQSADLSRLAQWAGAHDVPGRGTFFCVSTMAGRRSKEHAVETGLVHCDIDQVPKDQAIRAARGLPCPPSRLHDSGRGIHAYWLLDRPAASFDRVEALLKRIAECLAGDPMVTQSASLMRLPGTHNTKHGDPRLVSVVESTGRRYSLEELEAEAWSPVLLRPGRSTDTNPFTQVAEQQGFRPPMDVEARLAAMRWHGEGDQAVHATQLSAAASLMSAGMAEDEVVEKIMAATRAAVGEVDWNWRQEERAIRGMCRDWAKKGRARAVVNDNVVSLPPPKKRAEKAKAHVVLAKGIVEELRGQGEDLLFTASQLWRYQDKRWRMVPAAEEKDWIDRCVERGCRALGMVSKNALVNETRGWLRRQPDLYVEDVEWDGHGKIALREGLLDPSTGEVEPHRPEHRTTRWIDCSYDRRARCPQWLQMLKDMFPDQPEAEHLLQEVMGSFLVERRPRSMRRALVLVGGSNTGKSNLLTAMGYFFSPDVNTSSIESLENAHGLMPFLKSDPWLLHEAFEQGKWHFSATVKALLSADAFQVNVKNGPLVTATYQQPILWGTNTPPQFRESTKAMQNRLILIECRREFTAEPVGAAATAARKGHASPAAMVLAEERDGLLQWALGGLTRLRQRGSFSLPEDVAETMHEMWLQSNIVAGFMEECVEYDAAKMVATPDFCGAFKSWWEENRGDQRSPSNIMVGMALKALGDRRLILHPKLKDEKWRYYGGMALNERGLDHWQGFASSRSATEGGARISTSAGDVNREFRTPSAGILTTS